MANWMSKPISDGHEHKIVRVINTRCKLRVCLAELHVAPYPKIQLCYEFFLPNSFTSGSFVADLLQKKWSKGTTGKHRPLSHATSPYLRSHLPPASADEVMTLWIGDLEYWIEEEEES